MNARTALFSWTIALGVLCFVTTAYALEDRTAHWEEDWDDFCADPPATVRIMEHANLGDLEGTQIWEGPGDRFCGVAAEEGDWHSRDLDNCISGSECDEENDCSGSARRWKKDENGNLYLPPVPEPYEGECDWVSERGHSAVYCKCIPDPFLGKLSELLSRR